jgi:hypothetical protein
MRRAAGALGGVVAAAAALAVGYLVAELTGGPWPVDAVGVQVIDWSPGPVKEWAVRTLGTADRPLLRTGICATPLITAALAGLLATRGTRKSRLTAIAVAAGLGLVGLLFAGFSRSAASGADRLLPATITLIAAAAAMAAVVHAGDARRLGWSRAEPARVTLTCVSNEVGLTPPVEIATLTRSRRTRSATKWIVDFEVTRFADFRAYWTDRGWATDAPIKTAARIDVPKGFATIKAGPAIAAGVAWAQHRGIGKVEVRVDDGPWQPAQLARDGTLDTWRQWTFRWNATPGTHKLTVRATDGTGELQTVQKAPPRPDGASGLHNTVVTVE